MNRTNVKSTNIASIGYSAEDQVLQIEFNNGAVWDYFGVTQTAYADLMVSPSIGTYFTRYVRDCYPGRMVQVIPRLEVPVSQLNAEECPNEAETIEFKDIVDTTIDVPAEAFEKVSEKVDSDPLVVTIKTSSISRKDFAALGLKPVTKADKVDFDQQGRIVPQ